ncbi:uncharacterized protein LOC113232713, partial [Hyposmocoma kahamanoa]|uniref:uncharacterized protein LOC113232713 n=1 Tax=Hyposmocoma kahamanoa TaxID=1477025 RepID=UPI000E6D6727
MATDVSELIANQESIFLALKQVCGNYRKDSPSRKTLEYLEERLHLLNSNWEKFVGYHMKLVKTGLTDIQYFRDDVYAKMKASYEEVLQDMLQRKAVLTSKTTSKSEKTSTSEHTTSTTSKFNFEEVKFDVPPCETTETKERQQEMLRQQYCNFRAFERTVEKTYIEKITEKWELEDALKILKNKWENIEKIHWELDYILQDDNSTYKLKYEALENVYDVLRKELNHKIWNNSHYQQSTPKIVIPDFYGNYNQWLTFKDLFIESVHNNPLLSKAQKMQHLKSKLKGEAERIVSHLGVSAENYTSCWELLTTRYDNRSLLFNSYMNTLFNHPTLHEENAVGIRKLHDVIKECLNGLRNIGVDVESWGPIVVYFMGQKLDPTSCREYRKERYNPRGLPNLEEFTQFLETKFMSLESMQGDKIQKSSSMNKQQTNYKLPSNNVKQQHNNYKNNYYSPKGSTKYNNAKIETNSYFTIARTCPLCKTDQHVLMQCQKFLNMTPIGRRNTIRNLQLCKNCLFSHGNNICTSQKKCKLCNKGHHTLMHEAEIENQNNHQNFNQPSTSRINAVNNVTNEDKEVLLTTVQLRTKTIDGSYITLRGLLDQGSQVSLITEDAAQRLRLKRTKLSAVVSGIGSQSGNCTGAVNLECKSIHSDYTLNIEALVMKKLINNLPSTSFSIDNWQYLQNLKLADPNFNVSGPVDLLLGADLYSDIILDGVMRSDNLPVAQQTKMGWIVSGSVKTFNCLVIYNDLKNMSRFWESEEITPNSTDITNQDFCEQMYSETTTRLPNGNYVVQMPMKPGYEHDLPTTRPQALSQFMQLERKMEKNNEYSREYNRFMNEYITMGHMKPITEQTKQKHRVYLPHHGVLRSESTTTKLRAVFNASYKTKNNRSLNDLMYTGPNLQNDMLTLLINWRTFKYVFTADVEKMYRQIWLTENQQQLQMVFWRGSRTEPLQEWQLCTVTYGTKAAPYLAMRTLHQLSQDEKHNYPKAAEVLKNYFYMDDLVYGQDTIESSEQLITELIELLKQGGFNLRKWNSNEPTILKNLQDDQRCNKTTINFTPEQTSNTKTLGMRWNPAADTFTYNWNIPAKENLTKRNLLAQISKLYDPLGWLSPTTIKAKLLFQKVWMSETEWDEKLPAEITKEWENMRQDLPNINKLTIPRWLHCINNELEIHGYCDASEKAYACVLYSRVKSENGCYITTLITAKTKVAPLSKKVTLPRMELCGALLLAKLIEKLKSILISKQLQIYCWSDSKVVLAWLQGNVQRWERYIANRVTQINNIIPSSQWRYVKSEENPADCATRGLTPSQLLTFNLWWEGPQWLKAENLEKDECKHTYTTSDGIKTKCCVTNKQHKYGIIPTLLDRYSDLKRVTRVLAWIVRAGQIFRNYKMNKVINNLTDHDAEKRVLYLSPQELTNATELITKHIQEEHYSEEIDRLKKNIPISARSNLLKLTPYLDDKGLLRVKGRFTNSTLPTDSKHPIILPATGRLTELLIQEAHNNTLHGGARLTLAQLRLQFWIIGGNRTVKKQLRQCVKCHRYKPHRNTQLMADLPKERVTPARPFTNTGVDFTGHVEIKINKGRGVKTCKAYIAIFICMVTKAVHLELVSDLTTQTFLAAFNRMCARRGTPRNVFSDNGTNFVGASKLLQDDFERYKTFQTSEFHDEISNLRIQWHFNAPLWPTAGGLWEAAVKAMKYHLKRVLGEQKLTFQQFITLLAQIEACMNSRPLCPLSEDIEDLEYLTPGHFLIGGPLLSLPEQEENFNQYDLRNRWRLVEQMNTHIWKRWSNEYLHQLQERSKWHHPTKNLEEGNVVLVKDENLPPGQWALGRVTELHPGADGNVRVVSIKTKKGHLKRPVTKLATLPYQNELQTNLQTKKKTEQIPTPQKRNTGEGKTIYSLFTILLVMLTVNVKTTKSSQLDNYKLTNIENKHPIYFDEAGKMQLIHDEWNLLIYYNLTSYWQAENKLKNYVEQIDNICQKITYTPCDTMVSHLREELRHLSKRDSLLLSQHLARHKRGYFDGVGKLARTLFGVLDEDFAKKYEMDIEALTKNDNYLLQLIKNQTLIIEAENNIVKKSQNFMEDQFSIIHDYMNKTYNEIQKIENRVQMLYAVNDVNSAVITTTLILSALQRIQETLLNALSDIYKGHLDTHVFPTSQLIDQLNIISGKLPMGLSLPIKDTHQDIQDIYQLIYVKARVTENYLMFELHIPLLSEEEYKIYRIIPIPFM